MFSMPGASIRLHGVPIDREPSEDEAAFETGYRTIRLFASEEVIDLDDNTSPGSGWYLADSGGAASGATMRIPKRIVPGKTAAKARIPASAVVNVGRPAGAWAYPEGSLLIEWVEGPTACAMP